ncbi:MAG: inositol monophosphatase family protein [Vagococcus sp.]
MTDKMLMEQVKTWIEEAADFVLDKLKDPLLVEEKTGRSDLVTNVDKETERFLVSKIREHYPNDVILGEEGMGDTPTSLNGRIWVIDPIDGTLNFVTQQENFCIMLGLFEDGQPTLGFIYDVIKKEFAYGGKTTGVFLNGERLDIVENQALGDGLIGVNSMMFAKNILHTQDIGLATLGVRMHGCAGLDFLNVIRGKQNGYISNLAPWDFAAGTALSEPLGLVCSNLDGSEYDVLSDRVYFVVATPKAYEEIQLKMI